MGIRNYIAIARPEHWIKNLFVLPGVVLALLFVPLPFEQFALRLVLALLSTCLVSSANYALNEWLDAEFDRFHPVKKNRPSVVGNMRAPLVYFEYVLLAATGLALAYAASLYIFVPALALLIQGFLYNVKPFRTKDRIYLDVISESINNPIRLLIGWAVVTTAVFPPFSVLFGYWIFGAFLMDIKRYAELRFIGNREMAALYRHSFRRYTEKSLLIIAIFYALCSGFFFAIFMIKHRIELMVALPFIAALYTWYLSIGMKEASPACNPESLPWFEKGFTTYFTFAVILVLVLLTIDIPALEYFQEPPDRFDLKLWLGLE